jgi:hypothetical protein
MSTSPKVHDGFSASPDIPWANFEPCSLLFIVRFYTYKVIYTFERKPVEIEPITPIKQPLPNLEDELLFMLSYLKRMHCQEIHG